MLCFGLIFASVAVIIYSLTLFSLADKAPTSVRPHIIFVFADDLGWNDISFHGSPQIPTPNLDALASSGIIFNNYYSQPICSPSRAAFMTGKYPIRLGLQHHVIRANEPTALPLNNKILPQYLKELGYSTHMVGKWHLGCKNKQYTPIYRGFDSFFGYYNGFIDYYDYTHYTPSRLPSPKEFYGVDLHNGTESIRNFRGQYATDLFTEKANEIIEKHNTSEPLFLYLPHLAVHTGNRYMSLQAPLELIDQFDYIKNESRRTFAAMVSSLDNSVGKVFEALHKRDMLSNCIFVFTSDNGGEINKTINAYSSNYPLRGKKFDLWEGGIRVPAFIWSPLLNVQEPRVSKQLMHVTDWLPTLFSAAGGDLKNLEDNDGQNMWNALLTNSPSPRKEILHNIDPIGNVSALRRGDFKLVTGNFEIGLDTWYRNTMHEDKPTSQSTDSLDYKNNGVTKDILKNINLYLPRSPDTWREQTKVNCNGNPETSHGCHPRVSPCLFNITADPCEITNIADQYPEIVKSMMKTLKSYEEQSVKPQFTDPDPRGNPMYHDFMYVSWLDPENLIQTPFR